eukprot:TRINITY_DN346_c0_g3_i2.p1 TRINITY_DN346_c0_g3~~TRINITY_DN346_c0_g3_i2.p1  ORF type:complete len:705 (+),score=137.95 TRINITY_DN346_c0_g3_i2:50-2164(+)
MKPPKLLCNRCLAVSSVTVWSAGNWCCVRCLAGSAMAAGSTSLVAEGGLGEGGGRLCVCPLRCRLGGLGAGAGGLDELVVGLCEPRARVADHRRGLVQHLHLLLHVVRVRARCFHPLHLGALIRHLLFVRRQVLVQPLAAARLDFESARDLLLVCHFVVVVVSRGGDVGRSAADRMAAATEVLRQATSIGAPSFVYVMERWRDNPEYIWPGVLHCERVGEPDAVPAPAPAPAPDAATPRTMIATRRRITPKDCAGGCVFEDVLTFDVARGPRYTVTFEPQVETWRVLPRFYPKVKKYIFVYQEGEPSPTVSVEVVFFDNDAGGYAELVKSIAIKALAKLEKWGKVGPAYKKRVNHDQLVSKVDYIRCYDRLKKKYRHWFAQWKDVRQCSQKHVYEDIGIAAFLVCLCDIEDKIRVGTNEEDDKSRPPHRSFVDLGCGNGLLAHVLSSEGFTGYGVDLNERNVWNQYDRTITKLLAQQFDPSTASFNVEWLIGNHADELTPWVAVIASRCSYYTKFINLPCCFHGLSGMFDRSDRKLGKYKTYINWLGELGEQCGFQMELEWLRIPSTKNACWVGRRRTFAPSDAAAAAAIRTCVDALIAPHVPFECRRIGGRNAAHTHGEGAENDAVAEPVAEVGMDALKPEAECAKPEAGATKNPGVDVATKSEADPTKKPEDDANVEAPCSKLTAGDDTTKKPADAQQVAGK